MDEELTSDTFVAWLARGSLKLAQATSNGGDPFPELWGIAVDALDWLRDAPTEDREKALQAAKEFLSTGSVVGVTIPTDQHEADCLITLLRWIVNPPPVL